MFHEEMKKIFDEEIKGKELKYQQGSVKRMARCQAKAETDYVTASYPTTAKILDFIRCSLTHESSESLLKKIQK